MLLFILGALLGAAAAAAWFLLRPQPPLPEPESPDVPSEQTERLAETGRRLAEVVHELNNPLTAVLAFAQDLLRADPSPEQREALMVIQQQARRSRKLVRGLLDEVRATPRSAQQHRRRGGDRARAPGVRARGRASRAPLHPRHRPEPALGGRRLLRPGTGAHQPAAERVSGDAARRHGVAHDAGPRPAARVRGAGQRSRHSARAPGADLRSRSSPPRAPAKAPGSGSRCRRRSCAGIAAPSSARTCPTGKAAARASWWRCRSWSGARSTATCWRTTSSAKRRRRATAGASCSSRTTARCGCRSGATWSASAGAWRKRLTAPPASRACWPRPGTW